MKFHLTQLELELAQTWTISRNSSDFKKNFILSIEHDSKVVHTEIAPNIRYQENEQTIQDNFAALQAGSTNGFCHSFEFAYQTCLLKLEYFYKEVHEIFGFERPHDVETSFSIPIISDDSIEEYISRVKRFRSLKIKVNRENAFKAVQTVSRYFKGELRVDANESWDDLNEYLEFEKKVKNFNIELIEQPFPETQVELYRELKKRTSFTIIADESVQKEANFDQWQECFHGVNIKLQKSGGIQNAVEMMKEAKRRGMKVMLGCMIESSLGIKDALAISFLADYVDLDGSLLLKSDPYNFIQEKNGLLSY